MSSEAMKQMVRALEDTSASKHISRNSAIQAGLKAIAEAEKQEPVAWYYQIDGSKGISFSPDEYSSKPWQPLYTHPQPKRNVATPREWVGLTDEEIEDCYKQGGIGRAIQMLKDKNT